MDQKLWCTTESQASGYCWFWMGEVMLALLCSGQREEVMVCGTSATFLMLLLTWAPSLMMMLFWPEHTCYALCCMLDLWQHAHDGMLKLPCSGKIMQRVVTPDLQWASVSIMVTCRLPWGSQENYSGKTKEIDLGKLFLIKSCACCRVRERDHSWLLLGVSCM